MVITQASESAIRALLYMAKFPPWQVVTKREICQTQEITPGFLIKIMQPLIESGLIKSYRGVNGGFALGKPAAQINLWDIITASEGEIYLNKCLTHEGFCSRDKICPVHYVWQKVRVAMKETLSRTTLADLVKEVQNLKPGA